MINIVALTGRLTADPELRETTKGIKVTSFTIAVPRSYVKPNEKRQSDYIRIVCWNGTAEFVVKHFKQNSMIGIEGRLTSKDYVDKDGNDRVAIEVVADNISFCDRKSYEEEG